jgi:fructokinase
VSDAGRRPVLAAVEGGGTRFRWGVFPATDPPLREAEGETRVSRRVPVFLAEGEVSTGPPETTLASVVAALAPHRPRAVGLAMFGPLRLRGPDGGSTRATPKPGWTDVPVAQRLAEGLDVPVAVDTDVNAAAFAESTLGAARGRDPVVYVTVGTGVGFGVLVRGEPVHGILHPEAGHLPMPVLRDPATGAPDAFPGTCPFHGRCLEGLASGPALARRSGVADPAQLSAEDPAVRLAAAYLGAGLAAAALLLAPGRLVLGGGVGIREGFLDRVRSALDDTLGDYPVPAAARPRDWVVGPALGEASGLYGAALLAEGLASGARPPIAVPPPV